MYSKLSYFFLLVGLISQTIAAPSSQNEFPEPTESETTEYPIIDFRFTQTLAYIQKCINGESLSIFDSDVIQKQIKGNINVDNIPSLDEIEEEVDVIFDNIIDKLNNTDDSTIDKDAEYLVSIISSAKQSDLQQIIRIIAKSSKKLMGVLMTHFEDFNESIKSINFKIVISAMLKEDPPMSTYLLDFLLNNLRVIDRYQESNDIDELVGALRSSLEQTQKDLMNSRISNDAEIIEPLNSSIDRLIYGIDFISRLNSPYEDKLSAIRCLTQDTVIGMFTEVFMNKFRSAIDS